MGLLTAHTADKLKYVISPATRAGGLTDNTDRLTSSHSISKVAVDRVSEAKAYSDYIKKSEFETMKVFEFENNSGTGLNQMTRPDQDIVESILRVKSILRVESILKVESILIVESIL